MIGFNLNVVCRDHWLPVSLQSIPEAANLLAQMLADLHTENNRGQ